jgi:EmrB/QacA subfamily drug resistance transporter
MTELTSAGQAGSDQRRRMVFFCTCLGSFMATLDLSIVNIAFPTLEQSFPHEHANTLAWVITGYSIVFGALLVIAGRTADRVGARRVFFAGLLVFCLGSVLSGVAPSVAFLIGGRIIQGAGGAGMLPPSLGLLLAAYPADRRVRIVALWSGISALAVATGPSIGALLITEWGWRAVFFVNIPIGLMTWLLGRRVLSAPAGDSARAHPDYSGAVLIAGSLSLIVLAISQGPTWGWATPGVIGSLAGAVVLGALFLYRSARHKEPVLDLSLFRSRPFSIANGATFVYGMGFFAMLLGNILFLTSVWHFSTLRAGLLVTPGPIVVAIVSGRAGKLAARIGFRPVLLVGFALFTAGLCWYRIRVGIHPDYLAEMLPGQLIAGAGIGLTFPILGAAAVSTLPFTRFSVGSAVGQTARQIGGAIGVAILVVLLGTSHSRAAALSGFDRVWTYAAITAVAAALVCCLLAPPPRAVPGPVAPAHDDIAGSADVISVRAGGPDGAMVTRGKEPPCHRPRSQST